SLGYLVRGTRTVYFAGDTDLFPGMADVAGELDLALLPVAGWGPKVGPGHLDPERAAEALTLLRPRVCVPIHWGTYSPLIGGGKSAGDGESPAERFRALAALAAPS